MLENLTLLKGDRLTLLGEEKEAFDLIISFPRSELLSNHYELDILLGSCKHLTKDGYAILELMDGQIGSIKKELQKIGASITAIFDTSNQDYTVSGMQTSGHCLVFIKKTPIEKTFTAKILSGKMINKPQETVQESQPEKDFQWKNI
tara:strand:+ start:226 stop:666 length:441 start_codon:yes stop_codon:yes gene_type:complete